MSEYPRIGVAIDGSLTNVQEFHDSILPKPGTTGVGRHNGDANPFLMMLDLPVKPTPKQYLDWQTRVRKGLVRREEMIKGLREMFKERARVYVHDRIFGWILDRAEVPFDRSRSSDPLLFD